jgi:hypothetical protein
MDAFEALLYCNSCGGFVGGLLLPFARKLREKKGRQENWGRI